MNKCIGMMLVLTIACATTSTKSSPTTGNEASGTFRSRLDAASEVPRPEIGSATPSGTATFTVQGNSVAYELTATGLTTPPIAAHIHAGAPGVAGPVIVPLNVTAGTTPGTATGSGSFDASAIKGKNPDGSPMSLQELLNAMRNGSMYVNIHTTQNKPGEIRGQIGS